MNDTKRLMKKAVVYIHGKGGTSQEAEHYKDLFPECDVLGFDYVSDTPWHAVTEFSDYFESVLQSYTSVIVIANSIGAYYTMLAGRDLLIEKAYFISPIVNMEQLILDMMRWAGVTETELNEKEVIETANGETLSRTYLVWTRNHPVTWNRPTSILYGSEDQLQSYKTVKTFAEECDADLTIMEHGEHWFHTEEQMAFLDRWICQSTIKLETPHS